jgi:hypothetical protein
MSAALPPTADIRLQRNIGRDGPILLQKSQVAGRRIFRENPKREAIAGFWDYFCRDSGEVARQKTTHSDCLPPSIDPLQTAYSISPHQLGAESLSKGQRHSWKRC